MKILYAAKKNKNRKIKTFIILANERSGSTWLLDTMNMHPQILGIYEPFHGIYENEYHEILKSRGVKGVYNRIKDLLSINDRCDVVYGFKTIVTNFDYDINKSLALKANIVILLKRVTTAAAVSYYKSDKLEKWHFFDQTIYNPDKYSVCNNERIHGNSSISISEFRNQKIFIDIQHIRFFLNHSKERFRWLKAKLQKASKQFIEISYDKLFANKRKTMKKIYNKLGVKTGFKKYSSLIKITTDYDWLINKDQINKELGEEFGFLP